ncbi:hypothetical protein BKA70DRAFT_1449355 [Coprinopsis sp. MPI-PUGE-AT-0042]|nr:hypothetical protein BKA70DRAFT_1449355 [Coprinopsis sp. MPI-PUGE-AT-0042]
MALRVHAVQVESKVMPASPSLMPTWLVNEPKSADSGIETVEDDQHPTPSQTPPSTKQQSSGNVASQSQYTGSRSVCGRASLLPTARRVVCINSPSSLDILAG